MQPGQSGTIVELSGEGSFRQRLMEMGLVRGAVVEVIRFAPMGDPVDIKIQGYHLSLRLTEAELINIDI